MSQTKLPSLNKVLIIGNLTKDPESRYTQSGVPVANFKILSKRNFVLLIFFCMHHDDRRRLGERLRCLKDTQT